MIEDRNPFEFIEQVEKRAIDELVNPPPSVPLPWWPRFTDLLGGLRMHEFTVLTAPTGSGKTTFTANLVDQAIIEGVSSYICSAEIGNTLFLLAMYSAFEKKNYVRGDPWDMARARRLIDEWHHQLSSSKLVFSRHDDRIEPEHLMNEIKRAHRDFGTKLFILDNLQFFMPIVEPGKQLATTDGAIRDFSRFAKQMPVHCVLIAHPKKSSMGSKRVESEEDVKGSSSIYQECSNFISLNRITPSLAEEPGWNWTDREVKFHKIRRRGENAGLSVFFEYQSGRYVEKTIEKREEAPMSRYAGKGPRL